MRSPIAPTKIITSHLDNTMASQRPLPAMERHRRRSSQKILVMAVVLLSSCTPIASGFISSPSPLTRLPSTLAGAFTDTALIAGTDRANELLSEEEQDYYVHGYQPKTRPLDESVQYYASYVVKSLYEKRRKRLIRRRKKRRFLFWKKADDRPLDLPEIMSVGEEKLLGFREKIRALNEQRKNLVRLAGYTASIVTPSFSFFVDWGPHAKHHPAVLCAVRTVRCLKRSVKIKDYDGHDRPGGFFDVGCSFYWSSRQHILDCGISRKLQCSSQAASQLAVAGSRFLRWKRGWRPLVQTQQRC
mmetsp:Transcript_52779/g.78872  ORF Transcript_52779/g.78872 Transcript_52779/m.78872 type:complete len:301 (-) Transcript_52779:1594-2496(-)